MVRPVEELASPVIHQDLPVPNHGRPYPVAFVKVAVHSAGVEPKRKNNSVVVCDRKILWWFLKEKILWSFLTEKFCGRF